MTRGRKLTPLVLTETEQLRLQLMVREQQYQPRLAQRADAILASAKGLPNEEVGRLVGVSSVTVAQWRKRFLQSRLAGLKEKQRSGRPTLGLGGKALPLGDADRQELERLVNRPKTSQKLTLRSRIILGLAAGDSLKDLAARLGVSRQTVGKWRNRYQKDGLEGLFDAPRSGQPRRISDEDVDRVVTMTLDTAPQDATQWSTRSMARASGLSQTAVARIWRAFALKPHRSETFKLSSDAFFTDKLRDVVGLYLNPPERAIVLCVDEKTQIQALERTQPLLPMRPGQAERRTHDYTRHGITTLFAALNKATGEVIGRCFPRHRSVEFRKFLDTIDKRVPPDLEIHLILDNYGTHKTAMIQGWLARRPRYHLHFTPTSASWLNLVERWFGLITDKCIRRGNFPSLSSLEETIRRYLETYNQNPKPFVWAKTADEILENIKTFCQLTNNT